MTRYNDTLYGMARRDFVRAILDCAAFMHLRSIPHEVFDTLVQIERDGHCGCEFIAKEDFECPFTIAAWVYLGRCRVCACMHCIESVDWAGFYLPRDGLCANCILRLNRFSKRDDVAHMTGPQIGMAWLASVVKKRERYLFAQDQSLLRLVRVHGALSLIHGIADRSPHDRLWKRADRLDAARERRLKNIERRAIKKSGVSGRDLRFFKLIVRDKACRNDCLTPSYARLLGSYRTPHTVDSALNRLCDAGLISISENRGIWVNSWPKKRRPNHI